MKENIIRELGESADLKKTIAQDSSAKIADAVQMLIDAYKSGGKVLLIGNGGSAADAQHIAAEFMGRFQSERKGLPAIALSTNPSTLTAVANDYGYETVFARQIEALAKEGDVLIAISTSGSSINILKGVEATAPKKIRTIGLTGVNGELKNKVDLAIVVPSGNTARIQEAHITIGHILCALVEREMCSE
jgi:D-sedoheptulose 7-phosphate isomerase